MKLIFVQLPEQDPSSPVPPTNSPLFAGSLVTQAIRLGTITRQQAEFLKPDIQDHGGDAAVLRALLDTKADAILFSLYDYNYDRSLYLARQLRSRLPAVLMIGLGPEVYAGTELHKSQAFDSLVEMTADLHVDHAYPSAAAFNAMLRDLEHKSLQPRYGGPELQTLNLPPEAMDAYLNGIIPPPPGGPLYIGLPALDLVPASRIQTAVLANTPALAQLAGEGGCRELVLSQPGPMDRSQAVRLLKSLAAANQQNLACHLHWPVQLIDEELAGLMVDCNIISMHSPLLTTNPDSLAALGCAPFVAEAYERCAELIWAQDAVLKLNLYLGLPEDSYDTVIDSFDFLGMTGLGQEAGLQALPLRPGSYCSRRASELGITDALAGPPYTVLETTSMQEEDFLDAMADFEENFDVAVYPPVRPILQPRTAGFASCVDLRRAGQLDWLLVHADELAHTVCLLVDADDPAAIKRLCSAAKDIRRENPYGLWQLVLCSDKAIPSDQVQQQLLDAWSMPEHYYELEHLYSMDPQASWQARLFFATGSESLALFALHEVRELETIFCVDRQLPGQKLLDATPFLAFDKAAIGFELLYDIMNSYRSFPELLLEAPRELFSVDQ